MRLITDDRLTQAAMRFKISKSELVGPVSRPGVSRMTNRACFPSAVICGYCRIQSLSWTITGSIVRVHGLSMSLSDTRFWLPMADSSLLINYATVSALMRFPVLLVAHVALPSTADSDDSAKP